MKPKTYYSHRISPSFAKRFPVSSLVVANLMISAAVGFSATIEWNAGATGLVGNFSTPANWVGGIVPGASDIAKIDNGGTVTGASTVNFATGTTATLATLDVGASNVDGNRPIFNQTGGSLSVGSLFVGHANYGATKSPEYRISGGTLNISTAWSFGNGSQIKFLASGGTVNFSGPAFVAGNNGVTHEITLSNNAVVNVIPQSALTFGGGNANGAAHVSLSGTSAFNATQVTTILMGNDGTKGNRVTLADSAVFNAPLATFALGQWNNGSGVLPTVAAGTITLGNTSQMTVATLKTGGNNSGNPQWGVVNLNGGTLQTGSIQIGSSTTAADLTKNVVNANGGTIRASSDTTNFFQNVYLNIQEGGLIFDTTDRFVTITNPMTGTGGLRKKGDGILTLSSNTLTYSGPTVVEEGLLILPTATFPDQASVSIQQGGTISLGSGLEDAIGSLTLGGTVMPNGIYGSSSSSAPPQNQNDLFFSGTGTLRVGPVVATPRNLVWQGSPGVNWSSNVQEKNFLEGSTATEFRQYDNVTFSDIADPLKRAVIMYGGLQPSSISFNNGAGNDYSLGGDGTLGGTTGIVKNGAGNLVLGGVGNSYTGAVAVNAGKVVLNTNSAFGLSSGITVAAGAQVDINGRIGADYTYTIAGTGPANTAALVNSGDQRFADSGIKNLILSGDASVGNDGNRFDIGAGGVLTGNGHTLTKVGANYMGFRADGSGSPVNIVVANGRVWAETSPNAFGGATGTLVVKSGAMAGTYGTLSLATPVTIESGGGLYNVGAGPGTWTGAFNVSGNVTIESGAEAMVITGTVTGTANLTKTGGNSLTLAHPSHAGDTTITDGQLNLSNPQLSDSGTVTITGANAKLSLAHGGSDTVAKLIINGVEQAPGTYVSTTNTQALPGAIAIPQIVGETGSLVVGGNVSGGAFGTWANANITNPAYAALKGRMDDPDGDGLVNLQEFLFGTSPQDGSGNPVRSTRSGSNLVLTWNQLSAGSGYLLQESQTLGALSWSASSIVPANAADQTNVPSGYVRREATIPVGGAAKFYRVQGIEN